MFMAVSRKGLDRAARALAAVVLVFFILLFAVGCGARVTGGPFSQTDQSGARVNNYPGSTVTLHSSGTWTGSSPQQFLPSGIDMTDDRSSAIMPENANGARINGEVATILSGGDMAVGSLIARFEMDEHIVPVFDDDGNRIGQNITRSPILKEFELKDLRAEKTQFYQMLTDVSGVFERVAIAMGDDASQRLAEIIGGVESVTESPFASALLEAVRAGLTGGAP